MSVIFPPRTRDLRLDLLRGIANWAIFLNHMPNNVVNWITTRNYGFSDGADLFVFISGYTAAFVFGRMMDEHGFLIGATRIWKRVWQLYLAHVVLFVIYVAAVGYIAFRFAFDNILNETNVAWLIERPFTTLIYALLLAFKPVNLDVLPLYIVLMALFPFALWIMLRRPNLTLAGSFLLYVLARQLDWNLPAYPEGNWFFNPFCWQFLFCAGAWFALGGAWTMWPLIASRPFVYLGFGYLLFAFVMTLASRVEGLRPFVPDWLYDAFLPNDKTNLGPSRILHFGVIALMVTRYLPQDWKGLDSPFLAPLIKCGQESLRVFCIGILLSFLGYFLLSAGSGTLLVQLTISIVGIALLCGFAYYGEWSKAADKLVKKPPPGQTASRPQPAPAPLPVAQPPLVAAADLNAEPSATD